MPDLRNNADKAAETRWKRIFDEADAVYNNPNTSPDEKAEALKRRENAAVRLDGISARVHKRQNIISRRKLRELATEYQMYLERNPPQAPKAIEFTAEEKAESERRVRAASQMPMPQKWEPTPVTVDSLKPPPMEWGPAISVECERKQYHQLPLPEQMHPLPPDNTPIK